jgi:phosphoglycerol transferase
MDKNFCDDVDKNYQRKVYTTIINPGCEVEDPDRVREFTTFDHFPTTLAALGCEIDGDRLGLGTNLFSSEDTLLEKYGYEEFNQELKYKSDFMKKLFKKSR